jgi:hypothetical protein
MRAGIAVAGHLFRFVFALEGKAPKPFARSQKEHKSEIETETGEDKFFAIPRLISKSFAGWKLKRCS